MNNFNLSPLPKTFLRTCGRALLLLLLICGTTTLLAQEPATVTIVNTWDEASWERDLYDQDVFEDSEGRNSREFVFKGNYKIRQGIDTGEEIVSVDFNRYLLNSQEGKTYVRTRVNPESATYTYTSAKPFNLTNSCVDIKMDRLEIWEHDKAPRGIYNPPGRGIAPYADDDFYFDHPARIYSTATMTRQSDGNTFVTPDLARSTGFMTLKFKLANSRNSLFSDVGSPITIENDAGEPLDTDQCAGAVITLRAQTRTGYSGFELEWQQRPAGSFSWTPLAKGRLALGNATNDGIVTSDQKGVRVRISENTEYRVRGVVKSSCSFKPFNTEWYEVLVRVVPSLTENLYTLRTSKACPGEATGSITISNIINISPSSTIGYTVTERDNEANQLSGAFTANLGGTIGGLFAGTYDLEFSINEGELCAIERLGVIVGENQQPGPPAISFFQPDLCAGATITGKVKPPFIYNLGGTIRLYEGAVPGSGTLVESRDMGTFLNTDFSGLSPNTSYYAELETTAGCLVRGEAFASPGLAPVTTFTATQDITGCGDDRIREVTFNITSSAPASDGYSFFIRNGFSRISESYFSGPGPHVLRFLDNEVDPADWPLTLGVTDKNGCITNQMLEFIAPPDPVTLSFKVEAVPSECGETDGAVSLVISGGVPPYDLFGTLEVDFATARPDSFYFDGLSAGTFLLTATDAEGCTGTNAIEAGSLGENPPGLSLTTSMTTSCPGENDGSVTVIADGTGGPYEFRIVERGPAFSTNATFTDLAPGQYTVEGRAVGSTCINSVNFEIVEALPARIRNAYVSPPTCSGEDYLVVITIDAPSTRSFTSAGTPGAPECILLEDLEVSLDGGMTFATYAASSFTSSTECVRGAALTLPLVPDDYQIMVRYPDGCGDPTPYPFPASQFPAVVFPEILNVTITNPDCSDGTGSITVDFVSGQQNSSLLLIREGIDTEPDAFFFGSPDLGNDVTSYTFENVPISPIISSDAGAQLGGYVIKLVTAFDGERAGDGGCELFAPAGRNDGDAYVQYEVVAANEVPVADHNWLQENYTCDNSGAVIQVDVSAGLPPYSYSFNGEEFQSSNVYTLRNLQVSYQVRGAAGCLSPINTVSPPGTLESSLVSVTYTTVKGASHCADPALVRVEVEGGDLPFSLTLAIDGGNDIQQFELTSRDTTILVSVRTFMEDHPSVGTGTPFNFETDLRDERLCRINQSILVDNLLLPDVAFTATEVSCSGSDDGTIMVSVTTDPTTADFDYAVLNGERYDAPSFTATGLSAGDYQLLVFDEFGCFSEQLVTVGTNVDVTAILTSGTNGPCAEDNNGTILVRPSGGAAPYIIDVFDLPTETGVAEGQDVAYNDLLSAEYYVTVTDANGCTAEFSTFVDGPAQWSVEPTGQANPTCSGLADGSLSFDVRGGVPPLMISLDGGAFQSDSTFSNLAAGTYNNVVARDANGCTFTYDLGAGAGAVLVNQSSVTASPSVNDVSCFGESTGRVILTGAGGTGPYQYSSNGTDFGPDNTFTGLAAGSYDFVVRDAVGCEVAVTGVRVGQPDVALTATSSLSDVTCNGEADGSISIVAMGGTPPYRYSLNGAAPITSSTFPSLVPGTYTVTVTDNIGCTFQFSDLMIIEPAVVAGTTEVSGPLCFGGSDGTITITAMGGTPPFAYRLLGDPAGYGPDNAFSGLTAGDYVVRWRDTNGCESPPTPVNVPDGPAFTLQLDAQTDAICDQPLGSATVSVLEGGVGDVAFDWSDGQIGPSVSNLVPGTYTVTATDENSCTASLEVTILSSPGPELSIQEAIDPLCEEGTGSIILMTTNGTGMLTYTWSHDPAISIATATGLDSGDYSITVTDANNCTAEISLSLTAPDSPVLGTPTITDANCGGSDGRIQLAITGGLEPYDFDWAHDLTLEGSVATGLAGGEYTVLVADANGCTDELTITVGNTEGPSLSLVEAINPLCTEGTGSIVVSASGGTGTLRYSWSQNVALDSPAATNLNSGNYNVTVTDANGCTATLSQTLAVPDSPVFGTPAVVNANCGGADGSIQLTVSGGLEPYDFDWAHDLTLGGNLATGLPAEEYIILVTDANGCTDELTITVGDDEGPSLSLIEAIDPLCTEGTGSIIVSATGGTGTLTYSWSHDVSLNAPTATGLSSGDYTVSVTDANGCTAMLSQFLTVPDLPVFGAPTVSDANCGGADGSIQLTVSGGLEPYDFDWAHDLTLEGNLATGLPAEEYIILVTDANGCTDELTVSVRDNDGPSLSLAEAIDPLCTEGTGSITVAATGGSGTLRYSWAHNINLDSPTATNLNSGNYTVTVTDVNGCTATLSQTLAVPTPPVLGTPAVVNANCGGTDGSIQLLVTGGLEPYDYDWEHDLTLEGDVASGLLAGEYIILLTDANGCTDEITVTVGDIDGPSLALVTFADPLCTEGTGSISIDGSGGTGELTYSWSHDITLDATLATDLNSGDYMVTVTDANGCTSTLSQSLAAPDSPVFGTPTVLNENCNQSDGSILLTVTGGLEPYDYDWAHDLALEGDMSSGLSAGEYIILVTDANGCTDEVTLTVGNTDGPSLSLVEAVDPLCAEGTGSITVMASGGTGGLNYSWSHDDFLNAPLATGLNSGDYSVTVTDANGCTATISQTLIVPDAPVFGSPVVVDASCGQATGSIELTVIGGIEPYDFDWAHDLSLEGNVATDLPAEEYIILVTDAQGCIDEIFITVSNIDGPEISLVESVDPLCTEGTGSITVTASGAGGGMLSYAWSHDDDLTSPQANDLDSGNYSVTVTDANGCIATLNQTLTEPNPPVIGEPIVVDAACGQMNGSIQLLVSGGVEPYDFDWAHDLTFEGSLATGLGPDEYIVLVTDALGCTDLRTILLTDAEGPVLGLVEALDPLCTEGTGSITVSGAGGTGDLIYSWSHDDNLSTAQANDLDSGNYSVTVTDANGCVSSISQTLAVPNPPVIGTPVVIDAICGAMNGSIQLVVSGGVEPYDFDWAHDLTFEGSLATNLGPDEYIVLVTDALGCTDLRTILLTDAEGPVLSLVEALDPLCTEGTGSITVSGAGGTGDLTYVWSHDENLTLPEATDLNSGDYSVTVTDANGCIASLNQTLAEPNPPVIGEPVVINAACGQMNGSIQLTVTGGTEPYDFDWAHDLELEGDLAAGLGPDEYIVLVTDALGCTDLRTIILTDADGPSLSLVEAVDPICTEGTGSITVVATAGTGELTYAWSHDEDLNAPTAIDLNSGDYSVTVTDANGCIATLSQSLAVPQTPSFGTPVVSDAGCSEATGSIELTVFGGTEPYDFDWAHDLSLEGSVATDLSAGEYIILVTDALGCTDEITIAVGNTEGPESLMAEFLTPTSCGLVNGGITVAATGGQEPYIYAWSHDDQAGGPTQSDLAAGDYTVTVTDANGCTLESTFSVAASLAISLTEVGVVNASCGEADGAATVSATNTVGEVAYVWNIVPEPNAPTATGLEAGEYTVMVIDENGCTASIDLTVEGASAPSITLVESTDPTCGLDNGSITVTVEGGVEPYSYAWSHDLNLNAATASELPSGSYTVTVTAANNCTVTATEVLSGSSSLSIDDADIVQPDCAGNPGSISLTVSGGDGDYTYAWSHDPALNGPVAANLAASTYSVTVTDGNGCETTGEYVIEEMAVLTITPTITNASCGASDGGVTVIVTGGAEPYTYVWNGRPETGPSLTDVPAGDYPLTATDANGCVANLTISIDGAGSNIIFDVDSSDPVSCAGGNDGRIALFAFGGDGNFSFTWSDGGTGIERTDLVAGTYMATVTDGNACSASLTVTLDDGPGTVFDYPTADTTICQDDILAIDLTGDYLSVSVTSDNGYSSTDPVSLVEESGIYTLAITDLNGCPGTDELNLTVTSEQLTAAMVLPSNVVLGDTLVVLETSFPRPDNVSWVYDQTRIQLISQMGLQYRFLFTETGTYELGLVADNGGCSDVISKQIIVHADSSSINGGPLGRLEIRSAVVAPNPNQGQFTVDVQLSANLPLTATLYNIDGVSLNRQTSPAATNHQLTYNENLENGTYLLSIQTAAQRRVLTVVVTN